MKRKIWLIVAMILSLNSCLKDNHMEWYPKMETNRIPLVFQHMVNGKQLRLDTLLYTTSIGNHYLVNDLQYFISNVKFHETEGKWNAVGSKSNVHYIDARIDSTQIWEIDIPVLTGRIDSLLFTFGLDADDNYSFRFNDPPERDMFWPEVLGGGYHFMKMNLKWKSDNINETLPFMFHLGTGQMYAGNSSNPDSIIGFIQNSFIVKIPLTEEIGKDTPPDSWKITMSIENWFDGANLFDFSEYPMGIMQNQEGMFKAINNGKLAFKAKQILN